MNSPLKLKDIGGKDVGVTIDGNKITFSSTIYVTGPGASDIASKAQSAFNTLNTSALQNRTFTDNAGKCYEVKFEVHYVSVDPANPNDPNYGAYLETMKAKVGTNGNNIINTQSLGGKKLMTMPGETDKTATRSNAGHSSNNFYNAKKVGNRYIEEFANATGNLAYVYDKTEGKVALHETFHLFGLGDRYIEGVKYLYNSVIGGKKLSYVVTRDSYYPGFATDLMTNNDLYNFNQVHIDNLVKSALSIQGLTGLNKFNIGQYVDNANNKDKVNADTPKGDKTSSFTKLSNQ